MSSISTTWKAEATRPTIAKPTPIQATVEQWCSSGPDKTITGTRLLSTIENYTNWREKKPNRRNYTIKQPCANSWVSKWRKPIIIAHWKSKRTANSWRSWTIGPNKNNKKRRRIRIRKGSSYRTSIRSVVSNKNKYWNNGRMIGDNCTIITMNY